MKTKAAVMCAVLTTSTLMAEDPPAVELVPADSVGLSAKKLSEVDAAVQKLVDEKRLSGAVVLVARKGQVAYLKPFGLKNVEKNQPMTADTIFRIYSMSKAITSAGILMLADEGKLDLDDPISKYIPEFKDVKVYGEDGNQPAKRPPTVRDCLRHTAGFTYGYFGNSPVDQKYRAAGILSPVNTLEEMGRKLGQLPLEYQPGTAWQYSVSVDVLGRIIEVASEQKFSEFLQQRIFEPLEMVDTGFHVPTEKHSRFAVNYNSDGEGNLTPIDQPDTGQFSRPAVFESGGGGLVSTARDYFHFLKMIAADGTFNGKRLLSSEAIQLMTTNQVPANVGWTRFGDEVREGVGFGLGFSVRSAMSDWDPDGRVGEYGWGGAASTHYWVSPKDDLIVITMEQVMPYSFMTEFAIKGLVYHAIDE